MDSREERVRTRAYELWEQAGRPHGQHHDHWEQASRELVSDETGEDPVPVDSTPARDAETGRNSIADQDKVTPAKANTVPMREPVASRGAMPEGNGRRPL